MTSTRQKLVLQSRAPAIALSCPRVSARPLLELVREH